MFQVSFLGLGLLAYCALGSEIIKWFSPQTINFINLPLPVAILILCVLFSAKEKFKLRAITENLKLFSLFLLPFSLLIFLQLIWLTVSTSPQTFLPHSVEREVPENQAPSHFPKVVWIIFDELDYAALTTAGQNNTFLPDLEDLMDQSFVAHNAVSPHEYTTASIPALLTGTPFKSVETIASDDLLLHPADNSEPFTFRESKNIFAEVESRAGKSGIVGWYHPYPRIFKEKANYIFWSSTKKPKCSLFLELFECSSTIFLHSLLNIPFAARFFPSLWTTQVSFAIEKKSSQLERNNFLSDKADQLVGNPKLDLLFFHFSIPHFSYIARTDLRGEETYFTSLGAVNDTFKKLRDNLQRAGQWDDTIVIVSSDHQWRFKKAEDFAYLPEDQQQAALNDVRIPFIIKFAGQKNRTDYKQPFNTVITKDLVLKIFEGEIKNSEDLILWIDDLRVNKPDLINLQPHMYPAPFDPDIHNEQPAKNTDGNNF
jgi:hypothetical protein